MNVTYTSAMPQRWVRTFQRKLYCAAKRSANRRFGILYDKVVRSDVLYEAWHRVAANNGSCGVDGQSIRWVKEEYGVDRFLEEIQQELKEQSYQPSAIRRVYIPKGPGQQRPLGIPVVKDRVIQMAVKLIIEPLFEADFLDCSYGFRPRRSNQQAAEVVHRLVNVRKWVVDVDLKGYFDTIPHGRLLDCVRKRVSDRRVLHLIRGWMKAGIMEDGGLRQPVRGTPQGGVLSPLLSNVYLHEFDRQWDQRAGQLVRYADDLLILCYSRSQAQQALGKAQEMLASLELSLNQEKTKLRHVRDGFDFLGFTYREGFSAKHKRLVRVKYPRPKSMKAIRQRIKELIQRMPLGAALSEVIAKVNRILRGWANYFRIGNSYRAAYGLTRYVCEQFRIFWRRRKQRKRIRGSQVWPNSFFYDKGVHYVPSLL